MRGWMFGGAALIALAVPVVAIEVAVLVVELFQTQDCSTTSASNANATAPRYQPDLPSLGVAHWDDPDRKDGFAPPQYAAPQSGHTEIHAPDGYEWHAGI